jgi:hypothetical protein
MSALTACLGINDPAEWNWQVLRGWARLNGFCPLFWLEARARPAAAAGTPRREGGAREHGLELVVTPTVVGLRLAGK